MAEYIERKAVREILERYQNAPHVNIKNHFAQGMRSAIDTCIDLVGIVPAADVVPVVRCKDCKYYIEDCMAPHSGWCECLERAEYNEHHCSYGERKDGE